MSGPKCSAWDVQRNLQQLEAARVAALADADRLCDEVEVLARGVEALRGTSGAMVDAGDYAVHARLDRAATIDVVRAALVDLRAARDRVAARYRTLEAVSRLSQVLAAAGATTPSLGRLGREHGAEVEERADRAALVVRVLARLGVEIAGDEQASLERLATDYVEAGARVDVRSTESEFRVAAQRVADAARQRARVRSDVASLRATMWGLGGEAVERMRERLDAVEQGRTALSASLTDEVERCARAAHRAADRAYATEVLCAELRTLGYEVGESFVTAVTAGAKVVVARPGGGDYGVALTMASDSTELQSAVVRLDAEPLSPSERRLRDVAAEEAWCTDVAVAAARAARSAVRVRITKRVPAGANAVPVVRGAQPARERARPRSVVNEAQRHE